jgi:DNA modification methylase
VIVAVRDSIHRNVKHHYMLDPTCGSGTALRAAEFHKAKYVLGVEIDEEFAKRADLRLWEARRTRSEQSLLGELGL